MANKKQQKRRQERRKGAPGEIGDPAGEAPEEAAPDPEPQVYAGGGANPERREQKDAVRKQKERQLRAIQRNDMLRKIGVFVLILAVIGGGIWFISSRRAANDTDNDKLIAQADAAAKAAGCTGVETVDAYGPTPEEDSPHVTQMPPLDTYPSTPPASGPHDAATEVAGVKDAPPVLGSAIHSMEHGAVVVWYRPGAESTTAFKDIKDYVERNQDHVIMSPYDYPDQGAAGALPEGIDMSLTAWHHQQNCEKLSQPVVAKFLSEYRSPPIAGGTYKGDAPEAGLLI